MGRGRIVTVGFGVDAHIVAYGPAVDLGDGPEVGMASGRRAWPSHEDVSFTLGTAARVPPPRPAPHPRRRRSRSLDPP